MATILPPAVICLLLATLFCGTIATGGGGTDPTDSQTAPNAAAGDAKKVPPPRRTILLQPNDGGEAQPIDYDAALLSHVLTEMLEVHGNNDDEPLKLVEVDSKVLPHVIKWCQVYAGLKKAEVAPAASTENAFPTESATVEQQQKGVALKKQEELKAEMREIDAAHQQLLKSDKQFYYRLILAANYLHVAPLLTQLSEAIATHIMGKSADEIQAEFNIVYDPVPSTSTQHDDEWRFELGDANEQQLSMAGPSMTASDGQA